jgi:hypothetical protein
MLKTIVVNNYLTRHLLTFHSETDLLLAIEQSLPHHLVIAPVVDTHGCLLLLSVRGTGCYLS